MPSDSSGKEPCLSVFEGHSLSINGFAASADLTRAVCGMTGYGGDDSLLIRILDLAQGKQRGKLALHYLFTALDIDGAGKIAVSGHHWNAHAEDAEQTLRVWELDEACSLSTIEAGAVDALALSWDGRRVLVGRDSEISVFDLKTNSRLCRTGEIRGLIRTVAIDAEGNQGLTAGTDGVLRLWDLNNGRLVRELPGASGTIYHISASHDFSWACVINEFSECRLWNLDTGELASQYKLVGKADELHGKVVALTLLQAASGGEVEGLLIARDNQTWQCVDPGSGYVVWSLGALGHINTIAVNQDLSQAVTAGGSRSIRRWDLATCAEVGRLAALPGAPKGIEATGHGEDFVVFDVTEPNPPQDGPDSQAADDGRANEPVEQEGNEDDTSGGGPVTTGRREYQYDVVISFASQDNDVAVELANLLRAAGRHVFHYQHELAATWGRPLAKVLVQYYSEMGQLCVIMESANYESSSCTTTERRAALQEAERRRPDPYIVQLKLDDTQATDLPTNTVYTTIENGMAYIADSLLDMLAKIDEERFTAEPVFGPITSPEAAKVRYLRLLERTFGQLETPLGTQPLSRIYEPLPLLVEKPEDGGYHENPEGLHPGWHRFKKGNFDEVELVRRLRDARAAVVVIGDPGAGKTTLLRAQAYKSARGWMPGAPIPIYLHLGLWAASQEAGKDGGGSGAGSLPSLPFAVTELLAGPLGDRLGDADAAAIQADLQSWLSELPVYLLVDGVDEANDASLAQAAEILAAYVAKNKRLKMVLTSRPTGNLQPLREKLALQDEDNLAVLGKRRLRRLAATCLSLEGAPQLYGAFLAAIRRTNETEDLAQSPFLLQALVILFLRDQSRLPRSLDQLFAELCRSILRRRLEQHSPEISTATKSELVCLALESVAYQLAQRDTRGKVTPKLLRLVSRERRLKRLVAERLAAEAGGEDISAETVATRWTVLGGLLQPVDRVGSLAFIHRTIEEYLGGLGLAQRANAGDIDLVAWIQQQQIIAPEDQRYDPARLELIRWTGPALNLDCAHALVDWLCEIDDLAYQGSLLAARVLTLAKPAVFERCHAQVAAKGAFVPTMFRWVEKGRGFFRRLVENCADPIEQLLTPDDPPAARARVFSLTADLRPNPSMVARYLGSLRSPQLIAHFELMLRSDNRRESDAAIQALGVIGTDDAVRLLDEPGLLSDRSEYLRRSVAEVLGEGGSEIAVAVLARLLSAKDGTTRSAVIRALGETGQPAALPLLFECLVAEEDLQTHDVVWALRRACTGDCLPRLRALLDDPEFPEKRRDAVPMILGDIGGPEAEWLLLTLLCDPDWSTRNQAGFGLARNASGDSIRHLRAILSGDDAVLAPPFFQRMRDRLGRPGVTFKVQAAVADALGDIGRPECLEVLAPLFNSKDADVRRLAALSAGRLGNPDAVPLLGKTLKDPKPGVRQAAYLAFGNLGLEEGQPYLMKQAKSISVSAQGVSGPVSLTAYPDALAPALGKIGDASAIPVIAKFLKDFRSSTRKEAARALGEIGTEEVVPILATLSTDESGDAREAAAEALGMTGSPKAIPVLEVFAEDESLSVQVQAAKALASIGGDGVIPALSKMLRYGGVVSNEAFRGLASLKRPQLVPTFQRLLKDSNGGIPRDSVFDALAKIPHFSAVRELSKYADDEIEAFWALCDAVRSLKMWLRRDAQDGYRTH